MYIAENLKRLRKQNDMTQEDVAEILGVSPQSVSKWERGNIYPDITLLPSIANLYKISVDKLIGMEKINDDKAVTTAFLEGQRLLRDGDNSGAASIFTNALKLYPNDEGLMLELAIVLAVDGEPDKLEKAEGLCKRILSGDSPLTVLGTALAVLCYIQYKSGDKEKAIETAQGLPHKAISRFTVIEEIEKDPTADDINLLLSSISFRDNAEHDILVIDFGLDMLTTCTEGNLIEKIVELRGNTGKTKLGRYKLPMSRVRDNPELLPNQVRLRYFSDYLIDRQFDDYNDAVAEIIKALRKISK